MSFEDNLYDLEFTSSSSTEDNCDCSIFKFSAIFVRYSQREERRRILRLSIEKQNTRRREKKDKAALCRLLLIENTRKRLLGEIQLEELEDTVEVSCNFEDPQGNCIPDLNPHLVKEYGLDINIIEEIDALVEESEKYLQINDNVVSGKRSFAETESLVDEDERTNFLENDHLQNQKPLFKRFKNEESVELDGSNQSWNLVHF